MKMLVAAILIFLSGCQTLLTSATGTPSTTRLPIERLPHSTPHVQLTPNATKDRWSIQVTQQFDDVEEVHTVQQQAARRYLFWPLAPLNGLTQCPAGLITSVFSSREGANILREVGCMRLIAMEPLRNTVPTRMTDDRQHVHRMSESPVAGAEITFRSHDTEDLIHTLTGIDGRATVRGLAQRTLAGILSISVANQIIETQEITLNPSHPNSHIRALQLPPNPVFQVDEAHTSPYLEHMIRMQLLQLGFSVLPNTRSHNAIVDEQKIQLTGRIEDGSTVKTARLAPPTILIQGRKEEESPYEITVLFVKNGEQHIIRIDDLGELALLLQRQHYK